MNNYFPKLFHFINRRHHQPQEPSSREAYQEPKSKLQLPLASNFSTFPLNWSLNYPYNIFSLFSPGPSNQQWSKKDSSRYQLSAWQVLLTNCTLFVSKLHVSRSDFLFVFKAFVSCAALDHSVVYINQNASLISTIHWLRALLLRTQNWTLTRQDAMKLELESEVLQGLYILFLSP